MRLVNHSFERYEAKIERSGETFPTVLCFKSYRKQRGTLTVVWDTLYL